MPQRANFWAQVLLLLTCFAVADFNRVLIAGTLYWDTDGSTAGNNSGTGANLGGGGVWSAVVNPGSYGDADWWDTS